MLVIALLHHNSIESLRERIALLDQVMPPAYSLLVLDNACRPDQSSREFCAKQKREILHFSSDYEMKQVVAYQTLIIHSQQVGARRILLDPSHQQLTAAKLKVEYDSTNDKTIYCYQSFTYAVDKLWFSTHHTSSTITVPILQGACIPLSLCKAEEFDPAYYNWFYQVDWAYTLFSSHPNLRVITAQNSQYRPETRQYLDYYFLARNPFLFCIKHGLRVHASWWFGQRLAYILAESFQTKHSTAFSAFYNGWKDGRILLS